MKHETRPPRPSIASLVERLFAPVDIASIAFFRLAFGGLMLWHVRQYFWGDRLQFSRISRGRHTGHWITPFEE